jgi:flagellar FliJ protein
MERLDALRSERERVWDLVARARLNAEQMRDADAYISALADDMRVQQLTIDAVRNQIELKLAEVVDASKDRKLIEKLREKHYEKYRMEILALEQKELDDGASLRFARNAA